MTATIFSLLMAVLWSDVFILILYLLFRNRGFIENLSVMPLIVLILMGLIRLLGIVEFPFVRIIRSERLFPAVMDFLQQEVISLQHGSVKVHRMDLLYLIWWTGAFVLFLQFLVQEYRFRKEVIQNSMEVDPALLKLCKSVFGDAFEHLHIVISEITKTPMIVGVIHTRVILPSTSYTEQETCYFLQHELVHYKQKDVWIKLLVRLLCVIYWWNPLIYLLRFTIDNVMEIKSDLHVTASFSEEQKLAYLETILHVAKNQSSAGRALAPTGMAFVSKKKDTFLKRRFHFVLESRRMGIIQKLSSLGLSVLIFLCFLGSYIVALQPYFGTPQGADSSMYYKLEPDHAYLVEKEPGVYSLYVDDVFCFELTDIHSEPFSELTVLRGNMKNERKKEN